MKFLNCPGCGCRLLEGDEGSHVVIKCSKCNSLYEVLIHKDHIEISLKQKPVKEAVK